MPIRIKCNGCGKALSVPDRLAGKQVKCPACGTPLVVPTEAMAHLQAKAPPSGPGEPTGHAGQAPEGAPAAAAPAATGKGPSSAAADPSAGDAPLSEGYGLAPLPSDLQGGEGGVASPRSSAALPGTPGERPTAGTRTASKTSTPSLPDAPAVVRPSAKIATSRRGRSVRDATPSHPPRAGGYLYWLLLAALVPLAVSRFFRPEDLEARLAKTVIEHQVDIETLKDKSFDEVIKSMPGSKLIGAHLARDSWLHWLYALLAGALFVGILLAAFPDREAGPKLLLVSALSTATVGLLLLFCVQWMASLLQGRWFAPRGVAGLIVLVLKFIGFSYRSALDGNAGFVPSLMGFTFGVGFCEELCKAIPVVILLQNARRAGWQAAALVGMASGVGFGVAEGVIYSADFYNGIAGGWTYLVRFTSCVSLHAIWAGAVALLMYGNQEYLGGEEFDWLAACNFVLHYLAIAMVLHGLYDTLLKMEQDWWALAVAVASFAWLSWLVQRYRRAE